MLASVAAFLLLTAARAQTPQQSPPPPPEVHAQKVLNRGQQIAIAISTITSTAVSPLLGVCVLGVYEYFQTPVEARRKLPTYTKPVFWIPVMALLVVIFFKDSVGGAVPLLKKPLDAAEVLVVNKAALILIGFPVVFHSAAKILGIDSIFSALEPVVYAQDDLLHTTAVTGAGLLIVVLGIAVTTAVWLVSHAVDVLLLLNPFPMFDLALKGARTALFAVLAGLALYDPRLGAIVSGFVILISLLLAGWAFRLAVFGAVFAWDLVRAMVFDEQAEPDETREIIAFAARKWNGIPKRGLVHIRREGKQLAVRYRPFVFGLPRILQVNADSMEVGRGLFYPVLIDRVAEKTTFSFLPRFRKQEQRLTVVLGAAGTVDVRLSRGWHAFVEWLKDDKPEVVAAK